MLAPFESMWGGPDPKSELPGPQTPVLGSWPHAVKVDGIEPIVVSAATTQAAAIALYQSLGFWSFATEQRALKIGDRYVDQESMVLEAGAGPQSPDTLASELSISKPRMYPRG